jgi:hypothetical protein
MMNPWVILGAVVFYFASLFGADQFGHSRGINQQKVISQAQFDKTNSDLADQKAFANQRYRDAQNSILALQADRDKFKQLLGAKNVENQNITNKLRDTYAAYGLRFQSAENTGCGHSAGFTESGTGNGAGNAETKIVQLPETITRNLRQLAYEADQLNDDYKLCYDYANKVEPAITLGVK